MKTLIATMMTLAMIAGAGLASDLSLYGSHWDTDELDDVWGGGARLRLGSGAPLWLELRGTYFEDLTEDTPLFDVDLEAIPVDLGLALNILPTDKGTLYLAGGGTYFFLDSNVGDVDDEVGWYAGVGGEIALSAHVSLFAEFLYRDVEGTVEDDDPEDIEDRVDIDLEGNVVNVGLVLR